MPDFTSNSRYIKVSLRLTGDNESSDFLLSA